MKVEVKKISRGQAEINIELSVEEFQPFLSLAAAHISEHHKIPGFRPGKASLEVVKQHIPEDEIWEEALQPAVQKTFLAVLDQEKLITVGSPKIEVIKLAPGNPVIYKATISLLPQVKLGDYKQIKIKAKPAVVSDKQTNELLTNLQKRRAKETLVTRPAAKGDKVEIDFEAFIDRIPVEHGKQENFPLVLGEGSFIPGFEDNLVGAKAGETKEFQLNFPDNYYQKNLAGKLADFKVNVRSIFSLDLPELNDEFAKGVGQFQTLAELKKQLVDNLQQEATLKEEQRVEEELIEKLISVSSFDDIPDLLIDNETEKMFQELEQNLSAQGVQMPDYLMHLKKSKEDFLLELVPTAIKRVKGALVTREVGQAKQVTITDQELEQEVKKTLELYPNNKEIAKQINTPEYGNYLKNILSARKVINHLKDVMVEK